MPNSAFLMRPELRGSLRPRRRPAAHCACRQTHRRAVGRRRGRRTGGARRHCARGRRQSRLARPDGNEAAAPARPGGRAVAALAARSRGMPSRPPHRSACWSVRRRPPLRRTLRGASPEADRRACLRHYDLQEPYRPFREHSLWSGTPMTTPFKKESRRDSRRYGFPTCRPTGSCGSGWGGRGVPSRRRCSRRWFFQPAGQQHPAHRRARRTG